MRIRLTPDELYSYASRLKAASVEVIQYRQTLIKVARQLDWEISQRPAIESLINKASVMADRLSEDAYRLSEYLGLVGTRFQEVDSRFKFDLQPLPDLPDRYYLGTLQINNNSLDLMQMRPVPHTTSLGWIKSTIT